MRRLFVLLVGFTVLGLGKAGSVQAQKGYDEAIIPSFAELPRVFAQLKDKDKGRRQLAILKIAKRGEVYQPDVVEIAPAIVKLADSDPDEGVRDAACYALGVIMLDAEEAVPVLTKIVEEHKNLGLRRTAAASLGYYGFDARSSLGVLKQAQTEGQEADNEIQTAMRAKAKIEDEGTKRAKVAVGQAAGQAIQMISSAPKRVAKDEK